MGEAATIACVSNQQREKEERWNEWKEGKIGGSRKGRKAGREEEYMSENQKGEEKVGKWEGGTVR